ncbi:hypothetical protein LBMAG21_08950 [Armatimonadota bacterium]|nr:hypothetical protein LBMAG21_08950 [Armatimonadota bacterium]
MASPIAENNPLPEEASYTKAVPRTLLITIATVGIAHILWATWVWHNFTQLESNPQKQLSPIAHVVTYGAVIIPSGFALLYFSILPYWRTRHIQYIQDVTKNSEVYRQREQFLEEMQALAKVGNWEYDPVQHQLTWSQQVFQILEMNSSTDKVDPEIFKRRIHPEDRIRVSKEVEAAYQRGEPYEHEYRIYTPNGKLKYLHEQGCPLCNEQGETIGTYGTIQDVTALRETEEVLRRANEQLEARVEERTVALLQANQTLHERENFLRLIIEHIPLYLYWKDRASVYVGCNTNYAKAHYKNPNDIVGKTDYDLIASSERIEYYHSLDRQVVETNQPILHDLQKIENRDATIAWIDSSKIPMQNAQGETIGVLGYFEDVTARVVAVKALEQREEVLRTVIQNAPVILFSIDKNECFTFIDGAALQALNTLPSQILGVPITSLFVESDAFAASVRRALNGESHNALVSRRGIYFETHFTPIVDEQGEVQGVIGVAVDITERTRAEQNANAQQDLLRNVLDTAPNIIFVKDHAGRFTLANQATADLFGVTVEEIIGNTEEDFPLLLEEAHSVDSPHYKPEILQEQFLPEKRIVMPNGAIKWLHTIKRPLYNANGHATHLLVIATDITQRKSAEEDLIKAKEGAEIANSAKSQLIASMSHELRTPLNAVLGFSEMLAEQDAGDLNAKQQRFAENILMSGKQLLRLINDVLELAKLDAHRLDMEFGVFKPQEAIHDILMLTEHAAQIKNVHIDLHLAPDLPAISADQSRFKQILYTLIDNAIKFSHEGTSVQVVAEIRGTNTTDDNLYIAVSDQGSGIHPDDLERIFYETEPLGKTERHKYTGIRIGLALIRRLVEAHEGRIWAENREDGGGSRFCFEFSVKPTYSILPTNLTTETG